ncbi:oxygen-independent coproporphyrinogen III oxidase [Acetobacteraceae bacterium H6797]|nr:oxygen-independent coproporphyrinogen III oxidase [Acetobacteraceae bacterium H6797]
MPPETWHRYAAANLPRYTSYPTAPHFGPLDEAEWRSWLGAIQPADKLSLYLHIPFCRALCWYCGCHTSVTRNQERLARYATALRQEAWTLAAALPAHAGVSYLHLGGGTPTALGAKHLAEVLGTLRAAFPFRPDAELAIELDPRMIDPAMAEALAGAGITRASLGVQDISPAVQARIGRVQSEASVAEAVAALRANGIKAINLDIMYGLPGQGIAEVEATARFAAALGADRVAVFGYAHVPWMKPHQKAIPEASLPDSEARLAQSAAAEAVLLAAGYVAIGLDHFALPGDSMARAAAQGRLHRNFQGYTTDDAPVLLGLGASSIARLPGGFGQNEPDERRYLERVEARQLPIARGRSLTAEDQARAALIEQAMCGEPIDLGAIPPGIMESASPRLTRLIADGLVRIEAGRLVSDPRHRPLLRHFAACFDAYLGQGPARHSKAV